MDRVLGLEIIEVQELNHWSFLARLKQLVLLIPFIYSRNPNHCNCTEILMLEPN
jgi:hypothetical protein